MRVFQSTYVGRHDFPKSLPDFLLQQWFTLNDRDRRAIRKAFRSRHWIGAALQLGFVGMTGTTLRSLEYVPAAVLRHLGRQFRQPVPNIATLRTLYRRRPTRFAHQQWAIQQWGLREFDPAIEKQLTEHLHSRTNATLSRGRLEQAAREWLYRAYVAIPRRRAITVLVRGVVQSVALQDHRDLRRYDRMDRARFHQGTFVPPTRRRHDSPGMAATATPSAVDEDAARVVREIPMAGRAYWAWASNPDLEGASASLCPATASPPLCTHCGVTAISPRTRDAVFRSRVSRSACRRHVASLGDSHHVDLELGPQGCCRAIDSSPGPQEIGDIGRAATPCDGPDAHR